MVNPGETPFYHTQKIIFLPAKRHLAIIIHKLYPIWPLIAKLR